MEHGKHGPMREDLFAETCMRKSVGPELIKVIQHLTHNESHQFLQENDPSKYDAEVQHCESFFNYKYWEDCSGSMICNMHENMSKGAWWTEMDV